LSTEEGFNDTQLGLIREGELLSDQGYIVFRNLELTSSFAPAEDMADFGLDAIYVVTNATPPAPVPRLVSIGPGGQPGCNGTARAVFFNWRRPAR